MHIPPNVSTSLLLTLILTATSCHASEESGGGSHFVAILVAGNAIVLVVILFLLIIYYKKYTKLKRAAKACSVLPRERDREHDSTIQKRAAERRSPGGGEGRLVFVGEGGPRFELDDLLRASAEGLGRGNFGNCYKAVMEMGQAVVVKRLLDFKPLSSDEFVRHVRAIAELKHPNLLPLLAYYYAKDEERLFLYRFAPHGNLFNRLHGNIYVTLDAQFTIYEKL